MKPSMIGFVTLVILLAVGLGGWFVMGIATYDPIFAWAALLLGGIFGLVAATAHFYMEGK